MAKNAFFGSKIAKKRKKIEKFQNLFEIGSEAFKTNFNRKFEFRKFFSFAKFPGTY